MRKSLWVILAVLVVAIGAPAAFGDNYTINFTNYSGSPTPTGSFMYAAGSFSGFDVYWDGYTFDFTTLANGYSGTVPGCTIPGFFAYLISNGCGLNTALEAYGDGTWTANAHLVPGTGNVAVGAAFLGVGVGGPLSELPVNLPEFSSASCSTTVNCEAVAEATFTVTNTSATPEPGSLSSLSLGLFGMGLCWWKSRKREARGPLSAT